MDPNENIFTQGQTVIVKISNKSYKGTIVSRDGDSSMEIKVLKVDPSLLQVMSDTNCTVTAVLDSEYAHAMDTSLIKKKIPFITIKVSNSINTISLRKYKRIPTSIWISIHNTRKAEEADESNKIGDGTVIDLNISGCRIMTMLKRKVGEVLCYSLQYGDDDVKPLVCKGEIKNAAPSLYKTFTYGILFKDLKKENQEIIEQIIQKPSA